VRALPDALAAHLRSGATTLCHCWRLDRQDGAVQGFTDHDQDLSFDGVIFSARTGVSATGDVAKADLSVGGLDVLGALTSAGLDAGDLASGLYDFATLTLWLVNWSAPAERVVLRTGTLGEVVREDGAFRAEVRGPMQALETVRGRIVTLACDADLGDGRCGIDLSGLAERATVSAVNGTTLVFSGLGHRSAGWFTGGVVTVVDGEEAGARRGIVRHGTEGGSVLSLRTPLARLAAGDEVDVLPGCDKSFSTCREKFGNTLNFQGFPHLPGNDRAFGYARSGS
jgi:uncharacterized phage protein (TIGR02218 family)